MINNASKKQKLEGHLDHPVAAGDDLLASFGALSVDVLANIFAFLVVEDSMRSRRINKKSREAVKMTIPPNGFCVDSVENYNAMAVMTEAMPNLQQITICDIGYYGHKYNDGEDPNERRAARTANYTTHDIGMISNFSKLCDLTIAAGELLNGRYPFLFNSFPLLQKLSIDCPYLKWDLELLAGFPLLKELYCAHNFYMTGNISSLRVLKDTLEKVEIRICSNVEGNFMDLADFPHLNELNLIGTAVTGDIRDIGENDFSSLEHLSLPKGVYGGWGYEFQSISDGPDLVRAVYLLKKQRQTLEIETKGWYGTLSRDSPDRYESGGNDHEDPPFNISFVEAGSRVGYRWSTCNGYPCEVNWLDPEPARESSDYELYIEELEPIEREVEFYKGFHQPPTEEEYDRLYQEFFERYSLDEYIHL